MSTKYSDICAKWTVKDANWHEFMDKLVRLAKAVSPVVEDGMKEWFQELCQTFKPGKCCSPCKLDEACRNCLEQELIRWQRTKFELAWRNISGKVRCWQIAKLYMSPSTGRNHSNSAEETELSGFLCVLLNCPAFSAESKRIPDHIRSVVREILYRSNDGRHLPDHQMGSVEKQKMFRLMEGLESWAKGDSLGHEKEKNQTVNSQSGHSLQPKKSPTDNHHFGTLSEDLPDRNEEENEQIRDQLGSHEKKTQKLEDENATVRSANEKLAKENENLRQLCEGLQRENTELKKKNQELSDEVKKRPDLQGTTVEVREQKSKKKHRRKHK